MTKRTVKNIFNKIKNKRMRRLAAGTPANNWRYWNIKYKFSVSRDLKGRRDIVCPKKEMGKLKLEQEDIPRYASCSSVHETGFFSGR
jgi:hypothetical protein